MFAHTAASTLVADFLLICHIIQPLIDLNTYNQNFNFSSFKVIGFSELSSTIIPSTRGVYRPRVELTSKQQEVKGRARVRMELHTVIRMI